MSIIGEYDITPDGAGNYLATIMVLDGERRVVGTKRSFTVESDAERWAIGAAEFAARCHAKYGPRTDEA